MKRSPFVRPDCYRRSGLFLFSTSKLPFAARMLDSLEMLVRTRAGRSAANHVRRAPVIDPAEVRNSPCIPLAEAMRRRWGRALTSSASSAVATAAASDNSCRRIGTAAADTCRALCTSAALLIATDAFRVRLRISRGAVSAAVRVLRVHIAMAVAVIGANCLALVARDWRRGTCGD